MKLFALESLVRSSDGNLIRKAKYEKNTASGLMLSFFSTNAKAQIVVDPTPYVCSHIQNIIDESANPKLGRIFYSERGNDQPTGNFNAQCYGIAQQKFAGGNLMFCYYKYGALSA